MSDQEYHKRFVRNGKVCCVHCSFPVVETGKVVDEKHHDEDGHPVCGVCRSMQQRGAPLPKIESVTHAAAHCPVEAAKHEVVGVDC